MFDRSCEPATSAGTAPATRTGLRARRSPLGARIIFACDTYDAMTSQRPYRAALSAAVARAELVGCAGTQLDPQVVEALLDLLGGPDAAAA